MRFSTSAAVLALPLLATAAESPFEQYKAKFQQFIGSFTGTVSSAADAVVNEVPKATKAAKQNITPKKVDILTINNWKDTLYAPVKPEATQPEEWLVFVTGGNKTCYGHCDKVEQAWNETVVKLGAMPNSPHLGYLDCDNEPVLCNAWSASTGALWIFDMVPKPADIDVYWKPLNLSSTTSQDILDLHAAGKEKFRLITSDAYFHPFNGFLAKNNLAVPLAYAIWALNVIPSWATMLIVSFVSRSMMNRAADPSGGRAPGAGAPAAPRAAPPGDARS